MFRRYAKSNALDLTVLNTQALTKSAAVHDFEIKDGMLYTRVRAISARINRNGDAFPSAELKKAYTSFIGRPVFVNHVNSDHRRTRGVIVSSVYVENGTDKYIELVNEIDAKSFPRLAREIMAGNIDSVSMGCDVLKSTCSHCGNEATEMGDFCDHILNHKLQNLPDKTGKMMPVHELCSGLNFFEISYVFDPADETAVMQEVIAPKTAITRDPTVETISPADVNTLRSEEKCPKCGAEDYMTGTECKHCGHYSVAELEDPDLSQAKEQDKPSKNKGKEGKSMTTRTSSKDVALERAQAARRRIREAQRRLADAPFTGTEEDTIVGTPAPEAPVATTDEVRNQDATTNVQDLDQQVPTDLSADETTNVTVKDPIADVPAEGGDEADNIDNLGKKDASTTKVASEYSEYARAAKLATKEANEEDTYGAHNFARAAHQFAAKVAPDDEKKAMHRGYAAAHSQAAMARVDKSKRPVSASLEVIASNYHDLHIAARHATADANEEDTYGAHNFARAAHQAAAAVAPTQAKRDMHLGFAKAHSSAAMNRVNKSKRPEFAASITAADDGTGAHDGNGAPDSDADAAKPDARVDVTAPVADVNPAEGQETQYNPTSYDDNGGDTVKKVDESDTNIIPGQKASSLEVAMLVDQYVKQGLLDVKDKFNKWAEFENLSKEIVQDRTALLSLVASRTPARETIPTRSASASMPRVARSAPVMGRPSTRTATLTSEAELDQSDDSLTFL